MGGGSRIPIAFGVRSEHYGILSDHCPVTNRGTRKVGLGLSDLWGVPGEAEHREHRLALDYCSACGYGLHAPPGRCPECGVVPANVRAG